MNITVIIALTATLLLGCNQKKNMSTLNLTDEWDKTFPKSVLVNHKKGNFFKNNLK